MGTYTRFTDPNAERDHIFSQLTPDVLASHLWPGHKWERSGERKLRGCCPDPSHKDDSPSFGLDWEDGRTLGHCFGCKFGGDAAAMIGKVHGLDGKAEFPQILDIAARMIGTTLEAVRQMLRSEPSFSTNARPKPDSGSSADAIFAAAEAAKEKKRLKTAVRGAEIADFCGRLAPVTTCPTTAAGLARRAIDPKIVADMGAASALPAVASLPDGVPGWSKIKAKHDDVEITVSWWETGHRLIVPLRKPQIIDGKRVAPIVNVRARYVGDGPIPLDLDKSLGAAGASNEAVFFLSESVLDWWEGRGPAPETFVFAEGEVDRLTVETAIGGRPDVGVVGIVSKSLCDEAQAFFNEIPAEATIISLLHSDKAGQGPDGYQPVLHQLLGGRCPLKVLHLGPAPGPDGKPAKLPDENDLLVKKGYNGYDPLDPARLHDGYVPAVEEKKIEKKAGPANPADLIVKLAEKYGAELFVNDDQQACMVVNLNNRRMTYQIESGSMALELVGWVDDAFGMTVSEQAVKQAATTLAARAHRRGARRTTFMRVGASAKGTTLYLDLCDHTGAVVEIDAAGYRIVEKSPSPFLRRRNLKPLPKPVPGGKIDELWQLLNVRSEDRPLVLAWLVAALRPGYPYPVLAFHGAKGTGKSTAARVLRTLIDPHVSRLRDAPEGRKQVSVAAQNSWVVCYDNLSKVSEWLSDTLCGLATETSFNDRKLYKDDEEHAIVVRRPVIVTGIPELASEGDLGDRYLQVILDTIVDYAEELDDEEQAEESPRRAEEADLWAHFDEAHPRLLGALLDAVSCALRRKPTTKLARGTRMMDFAAWACAASPALGFTPDAFLTAYKVAKDNADATALESSPIVGPLRTYLDGSPSSRSGIDPGSTVDMDRLIAGQPVAVVPAPRLHSKTCLVAELYEDLKRIAGDDADWKRRGPKSSAQLSSLLRRLQPSLPQMGIKVELHARGATGRTVTISRIAPA